ncbi:MULTISPECIES: YdcF family protein [unclassified Ochrobactrum]|uniref:YdcF family protein n=1 Tax=unclassified Ochrobactrum TaxID=239106 RepID=UPI000DD5B828|nr:MULTISPECIES: YdcF family protein [unclassified Ochrobactrum]MBQ0710584.1 YdcF family protein [Ochrobactrum sp. AP1BH01-1]
MKTFSDTGAFKPRFSAASPTSRRNAGYDGRRDDMRIPRALSGGHRSNNDAVAQRQTANGLSTGDVVWRRRRNSVSLQSFTVASRNFLWSVMMRMFRRFQPVSIILFIILLVFLVGFVVFGEKVTSMQPPSIDEPADAIIVLTGGQSRIQAAVDLLKDKRGKRLLISGVHPSTNEKVLQRTTHADQSLFDCCVDLDRSALNTVGNAAESERWIRTNNYRRVILVTNNYHIPRSTLEMSYLMKDVEFIPYPVVSGERREHSWVAEGDTLRVLFIEYVKYLGAAVRVGTSELFGTQPRQSATAGS